MTALLLLIAAAAAVVALAFGILAWAGTLIERISLDWDDEDEYEDELP